MRGLEAFGLNRNGIASPLRLVRRSVLVISASVVFGLSAAPIMVAAAGSPVEHVVTASESSTAATLAVNPARAAPEEAAPHPRPAARIHRVEAIRAILGLVVILVLAYLAGHPAVREIEKRLGLSQVVTAGFPFVLLGLIGRHPSIGVLSDETLDEIRPLLPFGLGWIGFAIGFRFDVRTLDPLPRGAVSAVAFATAFPFVVILGASSLVFMAKSGWTTEPSVLRSGMILATAGAIASRRPIKGEPSRQISLLPLDRLTRVIQLEELAAVVGLILIAAFFRTGAPDAGWQLPAVAWIFVMLGMGTAFGLITFAFLASFERTAEVMVILIGAIAFMAGMASYLRLSPVVICCLAGASLANFSGSWKPQVRRALGRLEPPIYLVFLVIAGASWSVGAWEGWLLMVVFVAARFGGRMIGVRVLRRRDVGELNELEQRHLALAPMGALAVAVVVNAQDLYLEPTIPWLLTAILGGAVVSEVVVQWLARKRTAS